METLYTAQTIEKSHRSLRASKVIPVNSGLKIGGKLYQVYGARIVPRASANIYIDKSCFRGIVDIIRTKEMKLRVINHVELEDYLFGVLYNEVPHYWPMETLMAQAIAARTYALYRKEEMRTKEYDLTSDVYSQVYAGMRGEKWRTKRAVNLTRGQILTYNGKILPAYYHSICGGHTEDALKVWNFDTPPLRGVECQYCVNAKYFEWKAIFSYKQMEERLNAYGIKCRNVSYIVEGPRDASGRLETVRIKDSGGVKNIPANSFRLALSGTMIKSANFTIEITPKGVIFRGRGWGHGVGMCQWGAFGAANEGLGYKEILEYYYPGAKIEKIKE